MLGRVYIQFGQIDKAEGHFAAVAADVSMPNPTKALNAVFVSYARGDWDTAGEVLRRLVEEDDANHAVCSIILSCVVLAAWDTDKVRYMLEGTAIPSSTLCRK